MLTFYEAKPLRALVACFSLLAVACALCAFAPGAPRCASADSVSGAVTAFGYITKTVSNKNSVSHIDAPQKVSLKDESVFIVGDSIQDAKKSKRYGAFIQYTCRKLGAKRIYNCARSGAIMASSYSRSAYRYVMNASRSGKLGYYDYYFIAAGTNDYAKLNGKGMARAGNRKSLDTTTTCGALNAMIKRIYRDHRTVRREAPKIVVVSPIGRWHLAAPFDSNCERTPNDAFGTPLGAYRERIERTAEQYDFVTYVDGRSLASPREMSSRLNSHDGLHPRARFARQAISLRLRLKLEKMLSVQD